MEILLNKFIGGLVLGSQMQKTPGFLLVFLVLSVGIPTHFHRVKQAVSMSGHLGLINKQCRIKVMAIAPILEYLKMDV